MAQYLAISSLSASGIVWSTNKELKALAGSVNSECRSSVYLYGLSGKDVTILRLKQKEKHYAEKILGHKKRKSIQ
jgi:hypothetical protein